MSRPAAPVRPSRPIFIGGLMRSGTTLLRAMLGQHSRIAAGLETHWFEVEWPGRRGRGDEPLDAWLDRLAGFFALEPAAVRAIAARSRGAEGFLDGFMAAFAAQQGKRRWAEKTPGNVRHIDRILAHWPDAQIVHIVRDPKDVFASFRRSGKYGGPADYGALWSEVFAAVAEAQARLPLGPDNFLECRYEDLVRRPEPAMRGLLDFLGEAWEPAVARFDGRPQEFEQVRRLTGHASTTLAQLAEPLTAERIGGWQGVLSAEEIAAARAVCAARGLGETFARIEAGAAA